MGNKPPKPRKSKPKRKPITVSQNKPVNTPKTIKETKPENTPETVKETKPENTGQNKPVNRIKIRIVDFGISGLLLALLGVYILIPPKLSIIQNKMDLAFEFSNISPDSSLSGMLVLSVPCTNTCIKPDKVSSVEVYPESNLAVVNDLRVKFTSQYKIGPFQKKNIKTYLYFKINNWYQCIRKNEFPEYSIMFFNSEGNIIHTSNKKNSGKIYFSIGGEFR